MTPLIIDGKVVTEANAWRFVKARRPTAESRREHGSTWGRRTSYSVVRDRTPGAPWCYGTGKTAGEAWLKVARQMVEFDERVAEDERAMAKAIEDLRAAEAGDIEGAALRYAAERIRLSDHGFPDERRRCVAALLAMASTGGAK